MILIVTPSIFSAQYIAHKDTKSFSSLVCDYLENVDSLKLFYENPPSLQGIQNAVQQKRKQKIDRVSLVQVLKHQYKDLERKPAVLQNIALLKNENTFTICTAHQPNLLGGPLYFIYKIIHTVKLSQYLNEKITDSHFVPVFYLGSEDNDLEELGHFYFYGKKYKWQTQQSGAVGRMKTEDLQELLYSFFTAIGPKNEHFEKLQNLILSCFDGTKTIATATVQMVHELLGDLGVVVIDPDQPTLKKQFANVIWDDLKNHTAHQLVQNTNQKLSEHYKTQAFARPINCFYLTDNLRARIEKEDEKFVVHQTQLSFSENEIKVELENNPERFSPNVILRGLFQETILPNVAFIGGGAELAYWMQLKAIFQHYLIPFPVLVLRQSFAIVNAKTATNMQKTGLTNAHFFQSVDEVITAQAKQADYSFTLEQEKKEIQNILQQITDKAQQLDNTLQSSAMAVAKKVEKQLDAMSAKMLRAEKRKFSILKNRLENIQAQLFPMGSLQERKVSFMEYYLSYGDIFFNAILENTLPFGEQFGILQENN